MALEYAEINQVFPNYTKDSRKAYWKNKCKKYWNKFKSFFSCSKPSSSVKERYYSEKIDKQGKIETNIKTNNAQKKKEDKKHKAYVDSIKERY